MAKKHIRTQTEWEQEMCEQILLLLRDSLYMDFRYLDVALSALTFAPSDSLRTFATDGIYLRYSPEQILRLYPKNPLFLNRAYLHSVLHCIYRHLWLRNGRDARRWNIACDVVVEWTIDQLRKPSVNRILSGMRVDFYEKFKKYKIPVTAANVYLMLGDYTEEMLYQVAFEFFVDDHRYWPDDPKKSPQSAKAGKQWEDIGRRASQDMSLTGEENGEGAKMMQVQVKAGKHRRSYADFIRKFTSLREELHVNDDEFDLGYYSYGLRIYKDMPLIEPLETREVEKIEQFVIIIDTSYSTSGELVRKFLQRTFDILKQRDYFFRRCQIHLIQCDSQVRDHQVLASEEDIDRTMNAFDLVGGGSTDFRPAFRYINQMIEEGALDRLKGVLYFTDGKGIYPVRAPEYKTAFVFIDDKKNKPSEAVEQEESAEDEFKVPAWAMSIHLEEEDLYEH
ncbi:MAG: VWA-like domain-containing protein [Lachnospiraceae bacterium]|nr:VWA-like domain-containing protein [Lachnospiraceae bacterium]